MKKLMPYLLPIISILLITIFLIFNPTITGLAVKDNNFDAKIKISTYEYLVMPGDAYAEVSLDNSSSTMTFKKFIEKTKGEYELRDGEFKDINYKGIGYGGNHEYFLPISDFGLNSTLEEGKNLRVRVFYNNYLISESNTQISNK